MAEAHAHARAVQSSYTLRHPQTCLACAATSSPLASQVDEKDFAAPKPPSQLRKLFDAIGYQMSDAEFWAIYNRVG